MDTMMVLKVQPRAEPRVVNDLRVLNTCFVLVS